MSGKLTLMGFSTRASGPKGRRVRSPLTCNGWHSRAHKRGDDARIQPELARCAEVYGVRAAGDALPAVAIGYMNCRRRSNAFHLVVIDIVADCRRASGSSNAPLPKAHVACPALVATWQLIFEAVAS
jgi:hypothetical protein